MTRMINTSEMDAVTKFFDKDHAAQHVTAPDKNAYGVFSKYLSGKILDAGAGTGNWLADLKSAVGIDWSLDSLNTASGRGCKRIAQADLQQLPFLNESFDTVLCASVIYYIKNQEKVMREFFRVLKPEGVALISAPLLGIFTPLLWVRYPSPHGYFKTRRNMQNILQKTGFTVEKTEIRFVPILRFGWPKIKVAHYVCRKVDGVQQ